eukprot:CAMPEP_0197829868 /NCGR_PEP_ID=MMETSP1437-20131217/6420_1 /TAXON_ID=49252 ORGANISM="Eucampia antarctica, Strain CCMP1452" /NCGR_SAMPLE_ID=MMETSP1437 /ASSEMBLY_ACC=CAM_ASM_001096 /LENGTH=249 /DNA_ID=CAMNT_0043431871 /DNA_START=70 /DNA_END=819 /DNA_ORIENTATION=-
MTVATKILTNTMLALSKYHPVIIEGMGYYDPRDPMVVANNIHNELQKHWTERQDVNNNKNNNNKYMYNSDKPKLIIVQGDPLAERGISAITPRVAQLLDVSRGLICLDEDIASYHSPNADRENVSLELTYSELTMVLEDNQNGIVQEMERVVDLYLQEKNKKRHLVGKEPLKDYFRDFALLQEVTKAACFQICGDVTIAHTASNISDFSVSSFYKVGLELGLVYEHQFVPYPQITGDDELLDFNTIDKR